VTKGNEIEDWSIERFHHRVHGEHGEEIRKKFFSVSSVWFYGFPFSRE
jgi:hypothetical protein